jgi:hypothetical protein
MSFLGLAKFGKFCRLGSFWHGDYSCTRMKKTRAIKFNKQVVPQHRSFRRLVRSLVASFLKHQAIVNEYTFQREVMQRLKALEDKIEVVSRRENMK